MSDLLQKEIHLPHNWRPRSYQKDAWAYMMSTPLRARGVCLWHRRAGKDLFGINVAAVKAHERVGTYWHVFPTYRQGKNVIWNGATKDGRRFLDHFPKELIANVNNTDMRITFHNGSIYQVVGTDNIDSLVGTNPVGAIFSEYSLQNPAAWDYIRPIVAENDGWALFLYTARGKNHGFKLYTQAVKNPTWFAQLLKAGSGPECTKREDGLPVIPDELIEEERKSGMPDEIVAQEFFNSFEAPMYGAYYSVGMTRMEETKRITAVAWEPRLAVNTYWDLGMGDSTAILFVQQHGAEYRIIDCYENSGEGLGHYAKVLRGQVEGGGHRADYVYGRHYAPHDIEVRELTSGKSRIETARSMGIKFSVVPKHGLEDGIEATRNILPQVWIDEKSCGRLIEALRGYRKEWDEKNKCFRDHPLHDWTSHFADAMRYFAWSCKGDRTNRRRLPQETAIDEYDYLRGVAPENDYPEPNYAADPES